MKPKIIKINLIIHLFALAHSLMAIIFRYWLGWNDEIILTILTIMMVFWITRLYGVPIDVGAVLTLLSTLAGYYIGTQGAEWMAGNYLFVAPCSNIVMTFLVTEFLGWATFFIIRRTQIQKKTNI